MPVPPTRMPPHMHAALERVNVLHSMPSRLAMRTCVDEAAHDAEARAVVKHLAHLHEGLVQRLQQHTEQAL